MPDQPARPCEKRALMETDDNRARGADTEHGSAAMPLAETLACARSTSDQSAFGGDSADRRAGEQASSDPSVHVQPFCRRPPLPVAGGTVLGRALDLCLAWHMETARARLASIKPRDSPPHGLWHALAGLLSHHRGMGPDMESRARLASVECKRPAGLRPRPPGGPAPAPIPVSIGNSPHRPAVRPI